MTTELDQLCINTMRFLSVDAVQKANSGHPGMPLGAAPMAYVLWTRFLKHNPRNPAWFDRDRFVLSAGHGSMLLYSLLHLTGYDLSLDEIKQFRQWGSKTPGHPERGHTPGVEVTTGPLGQGFANAVGMAIAEAQLAARYNRPGFEIIDHATYVIVSDGDLMEGVASEAASLAGHLRLGKLICLYDDNRVTLAAGTDLTFTEDRARRFEAYGWHTQSVADGNDLGAIDAALQAARAETARPSLILVRTHIGYGSPNKQDTFEAHGSPLGADEVRLTKEQLGWPTEPAVPDSRTGAGAFPRGGRARRARRGGVERSHGAPMRRPSPIWRRSCERSLRGELPPDWDADIPVFPADAKGHGDARGVGQGDECDRAAAAGADRRLGRSRSLDPHRAQGARRLQSAGRDDAIRRARRRRLELRRAQHPLRCSRARDGRHRQRPGGAWRNRSRTARRSSIFSDYMRPPIRLAALMELHVIHVFTHDSIALGEDGPTHQPVEQLAALRAIPNLTVIRPADANETAVAWRVALRDARPSGRAGADAAGRAHARSQPLRVGRRPAPRRVRADRCAGRRARTDPDRQRIGGRPDRGRSGAAAGAGRRGALRLDAELGAVRRRCREANATPCCRRR